MRVSTIGHFNTYVSTALGTLENGYDHLKIVGRGEAVPIAEDLLKTLSLKARYCTYSTNYTQALNKRGVVVPEIHIMVSRKTPIATSNSTNYQSAAHHYPTSARMGGKFSAAPAGGEFKGKILTC